MTERQKIIWYTDTHFGLFPWKVARLIAHVKHENPSALFLTGDISHGLFLTRDLSLLANSLSCPIYFILGNHDYFFSSFAKTHDKIKEMCAKHSNLIWMTDTNVVGLNEEVALIGEDGWYDSELGDTKWLKYMFDWFMIEEPRKLPSMAERIEFFRQRASKSAERIAAKLEKAWKQDYKTVFILTHMPPWKEATRDEHSIWGKFYLPYNTNLRMGRAIEDVMEGKKNKRAIIYSGHSHEPISIMVSRNIECRVGKAHYYVALNDQKIFL